MEDSVAKIPVPTTGIGFTNSESPAPLPQPPAQIEVDDSQVAACYANFCRIMGTPEELLIDFGLSLTPTGARRNRSCWVSELSRTCTLPSG